MITAAKEFENALLELDTARAKSIFMLACATRPAFEAVESVILPALDSIGVEWEKGTLALSQVYVSSKVCEDLVNAILPVCGVPRKTRPKMAIVTLEDHHALGKRLVFGTLRSAGYNLIDYGRKRTDALVAAAQADQLEVLLISTLMLPSALRIKQVRERLASSLPNLKIVVGGAPFRLDPSLWQEVGAYATSPSASGVLDIINPLSITEP